MAVKGANRLTLSHMFSVLDWLKEHKDTLHNLTFSEVAKKAQNDLGFTISQTNIRTISQEAGITWHHRRQVAMPHGGTLMMRMERNLIMRVIESIEKLDVTPLRDRLNEVNKTIERLESDLTRKDE